MSQREPTLSIPLATLAARNPLFLREEELDRGLELLLLAERDLLADMQPDLVRHGLSAQDYRVLYLVHRHPGTTLAELTAALGTTKQNLSRVLRSLLDAGLLRGETPPHDRRKRVLHATPAAQPVLAAMGETQKRILGRAFKKAGAQAVEGFQQVVAELGGPAMRRLGGRERR